MRILFDQGTPVAIRSSLSKHVVRTAYEEGWSTLSNGELLAAAEHVGLEVLLTTDAHLPDQQNIRERKIAVVILTKNRWLSLQPKLAAVVAAVEAAKPGTCTFVEISDL